MQNFPQQSTAYVTPTQTHHQHQFLQAGNAMGAGHITNGNRVKEEQAQEDIRRSETPDARSKVNFNLVAKEDNIREIE